MLSSKNIVLCFDGTDNNFGRQAPSNILKLYKLLDKNSQQQQCFYQPGVGNDIGLAPMSFNEFTPMSEWYRKFQNGLDASLAYTIDYHVIQAYRFLIQNYSETDKIYLFGFSRGSFVARILAGMIEKIGLLDHGLEAMVSTAWEIYKNWEKDGQPNEVDTDPKTCTYSVRNFKKAFCRENVSIEFMGLWDSINSCGILRDRLFPYTSSTLHVKHIRHAVSLHERRSKLKQNLFTPFSYLPSFLTRSNNPTNELENNNDYNYNSLNSPLSITALPDEDSVTRTNAFSSSFSKCSSDLLEVFFPGDHSDIGGNWPTDECGDSLSDVSFRWLLSFAIEFGVSFKKNSVLEFFEKFKPINSCLSSHHDALSFKRFVNKDQKNPYCIEENSLFPTPKAQIELPKAGETFSKNKGHADNTYISTILWWIIEILPVGYLIENKQGKWRPIYWPNLGNKRNIPDNAKIHWSVIWRMKFIDDMKYDNLPLVYNKLEKLIHLDGKYSDEEDNIIILRLEDLVDIKTGTIRSEVINFLLKNDYDLVVNKIKLDVDWQSPPDELHHWLGLEPSL